MRRRSRWLAAEPDPYGDANTPLAGRAAGLRDRLGLLMSDKFFSAHLCTSDWASNRAAPRRSAAISTTA